MVRGLVRGAGKVFLAYSLRSRTIVCREGLYYMLLTAFVFVFALLGDVNLLVVLAGIGYACAALITPLVTRRLSKPAWITLLLAASAVVTLALGETFSQPAYLGIGFLLYLTRQGVAICATTILQEEVDDAYRGRVFAFYDMMFNAAYVAGAALSVVIMPADGHSPGLIGLVAAGYAVVAAGYWLASRRDKSSSGGSEPEIPSTAAAQRSNS